MIPMLRLLIEKKLPLTRSFYSPGGSRSEEKMMIEMKLPLTRRFYFPGGSQGEEVVVHKR